MPAGRKKGEFKQWLSGLFTAKDKTLNIADGSRHRVAPEGFISHAQDFIIQNPTMTAVHGNQYTTNVQGDRNIMPHIMGLLSQHIIQGAAHDSSARTPPPRCHPDTRVKLIARITAWFEGENLQDLLLWITGPAGVGKSAIVQTVAEYLSKSKSLGASVFISRPNKRNNPHGIFITIAYQLATRIEAYRNFVVERISFDPELLRGDIQAQFTAFIVEPFVEKRIGEGGKRWGILLDGLDELRGEDAQCNIIQLISTFIREHPNVPLIWIIASRPESRISNTFDEPEVRSSCWTEYIPIDSTEACEDVERFLRSSFNTIRKNFRQVVPNDWPSNTDFLKLTVAASGLFVYAEVATQFVRDPDHADPVSRFEVLISVIDRSTTVQAMDNPFIQLDALYHEIVSHIPLTLWPTTKRLLGCIIHHGANVPALLYLPFDFRTPRGMSILFNLTRHTIYASLIKCQSVLWIPDWKNAHKERLAFLHASFADYLKDPGRSGDFHVSNPEDVEDAIAIRLLDICNKCSGDDVTTASVEPVWLKYCSDSDDQAPSKAVMKHYAKLLRGVVRFLVLITPIILQKPADSLVYRQFRKLHIAKLCYYISPHHLGEFVYGLEAAVPVEFNDTGLYRETRLENLKLAHLDWKEMSPATAYLGQKRMFSRGESFILHRPRSNVELKAFMSELEHLQEHSPGLKVVIFGGVPKWRVAAFRRETDNGDICYVIPYPE